jgi:hypothetical protein
MSDQFLNIPNVIYIPSFQRRGKGADTFYAFSFSAGVESGSRSLRIPAGGGNFMSQKTFSRVAGLIFLLVAIMHALRLAFRWEVVLNGWSVPLWVSGVALVVAGFLASEGFRHSRSR